MILNSCA